MPALDPNRTARFNLWKMLFMIPGNVWRVLHGNPGLLHSAQPADLPPALARRRVSLWMRHLDCGSCNGCELELQALTSPVYDMGRYGLRFVPSPRHANLLVMTGPLTKALSGPALLTLQAMPQARVLALGDCAVDGGEFQGYFTIAERPKELEEAIVMRLPGCPPAPETILRTLLQFEL